MVKYARLHTLVTKPLQHTAVWGFVMVLMAAFPAQALEYKVTSPMVFYRLTAVQTLLDQAKALLPETVKSQLGSVEVRFEKVITGSGNEAWGVSNAYKQTITLQESLVPEILKGAKYSSPSKGAHKTLYAEALATVIHETIHLYDYANIHSDEEKNWIDRCDTKFAKDKDDRIRNGSRPYACKYYENMTTSFSKNPYFLQVAGWMGTGDNGFTGRSPNIYEVKNPQEYLAVNMEYFLMDPDYKCRRPTMYKVLSAQFKHVPFQGVNCERQLSYVLPNGNYEKAQLLKVDPSRVYQIHYLFADKGADLVSGWGHSMIRLVICSPQRKVVGSDCLRDVEYHVVLSFRAFVDSLVTSTWAGLVGDYPSRLFILPLSQVINEYSKTQFRTLKSMPLILSRKQIDEFVTRSVEVHWGYDGKYKFVTNNCATETLNLLQSVLLTPQILFTELKTPKALYDVLVKQRLADEMVFRDKKKAIELGFLFESYEERYKKTFAIVKESSRVTATDFKAYIASSASERNRLIMSVNKSQPNFKKVAASLFLLEMAAQNQLQNDVLMELQNLFIQAKQRGDVKAEIVNKSYLQLAESFSKPVSFIKEQKGYGLPTGSEIAAAGIYLSAKAEMAKSLAGDVKLLSNQVSGDLLAEVELVKTNLETLQKLLKEK